MLLSLLIIVHHQTSWWGSGQQIIQHV